MGYENGEVKGQSLRVWEIPDGDTEILWTVRTVRAFMFICC